jgi:hypothetical protein
VRSIEEEQGLGTAPVGANLCMHVESFSERKDSRASTALVKSCICFLLRNINKIILRKLVPERAWQSVCLLSLQRRKRGAWDFESLVD